MTPERIEQLRKQYEFPIFGDARNTVIMECLDEIERLRTELAKHQESEFHPDWSMLEASRKSLREAWQEISRLQALLPPSDDGEPVTAEWLESVGLRGVLIDQDDVTFEVHEYGSSVAGDCFCIDLKCQTRGDARRLAAVFGIKLHEGDQ